MRYEKPEVVLLAPALSSIQGTCGSKKTSTHDGCESTTSAYEADE
jgi:hypothetical protein